MVTGNLMPIYEYSCTACGTFDVEQRITESALTQCDRCGGPVKRLISRSSFALRGGGWYSDGYARKAAPADKDAAKECGSGGCGGGACKTAEA
jgi:putative FmdB family regulatory protein